VIGHAARRFTGNDETGCNVSEVAEKQLQWQYARKDKPENRGEGKP